MVRSGLERLGFGLVVLAMCVVLAQPAEVVTLQEDLTLITASNTTTPQPQASNASEPVPGSRTVSNTTSPFKEEPHLPITPELQSYMVKVTDVLKEEGKDVEQHDIEGLARNLMLVDHAEKDTPRMREIARSLRTEGPKVHRVEVDPKTYARDSEIRKKEEKAKRAEKARQRKMKRDAKRAKAREARRAKQMIVHYRRSTFNPKLEKEIKNAKQSLNKAHEHMKATYKDVLDFDQADHPHKPDDEPEDEYGIIDQSKWGPPAPVKKKSAAPVQQQSAAPVQQQSAAGGKGM